MEEKTIKSAKLSLVAYIFKFILDLFACCFLIGFIWLPKDLIKFFTTKIEITNKRIIGKTGLVNTNELDSPLNKINGIQVIQGMLGKIFNYGTIKITTASSFFIFNYVKKTNDFKTILNNQIEAYEDEKINKQAQRLANAIKN